MRTDRIVKHQIQAEAWYVANPNLTVAKTRRLERIGEALDEFLDKISELRAAGWNRCPVKGDRSKRVSSSSDIQARVA